MVIVSPTGSTRSKTPTGVITYNPCDINGKPGLTITREGAGISLNDDELMKKIAKIQGVDAFLESAMNPDVVIVGLAADNSGNYASADRTALEISKIMGAPAV